MNSYLSHANCIRNQQQIQLKKVIHYNHIFKSKFGYKQEIFRNLWTNSSVNLKGVALSRSYCQQTEVSSSELQEKKDTQSSDSKKEDENKQPHTVLIDGSHLFYKAYYSNKFNPTRGAIYGLTRILLKVMKDLQPYNFIGVCFDPPGRKTFRDQLYPDYKKGRAELPQEFKSQFPLIPRVMEACNVPFLRIQGYEADDLIATYTKQAEKEGHRVTIVSLDKDLFQLCGPNVRLWDSTEAKPLATDKILEKYGVEPHLLPHLQCLTGDSVDNIKGVPGIGPKTAAQLIKEFGPIPQLIESLDKVTPPSKKRILEEHKELIISNWNLVKLKEDVDVPLFNFLTAKPIEKETLISFLKEEKFTSILMKWYKDNPDNNNNNQLQQQINQYQKNIQAKRTATRLKNTDSLQFIDTNSSILTHTSQILAPDSNTTNSPSSKSKRKKQNTEEDENSSESLLAKELTDSEIAEEEIDNSVEVIKLPEVEYSVEELHKLAPEGVTVVADIETAKSVVSKLLTLKDRYHAVDTEAINFDTNKTVIGQKIEVICASIYSGPDVDFGNGPKIWIDNLGQCAGVLNVFKEFFEREDIKKVFHNFSFDKYALSCCGIQVKGFAGDTMQMARLWNSSRIWNGGYSLQGLISDLGVSDTQKKSIKERFGQKKLKKDGSEGKVIVIPELSSLQRNPTYIHDWIDYSAFDAEGAWRVREELQRKLSEMPWRESDNSNMWEFYQKEWLPFGELLTEMEYEGIKVDVKYLKEIEQTALKDYQQFKTIFINWASKYCPDAALMNIESDAQKQQLLFSPYLNVGTKKEMPAERTFEAPNTVGFIEPGKTKPLKNICFTLKGLGLPPAEFTNAGFPAVSADALKKLAGDPSKQKWGIAYNHYTDPEEGKQACIAIDALLEAGKISTLLSTFIQPLQEMVDNKSRIHTSININTETGRLSSRKPNLQNQPALEKDRYKIRDAFTCDDGNLLIVADYGQLELRILAHITACKSMIQAFKKGGDFHSRTAMGMYPEIAEAVEKGDVLLEWDYSKGSPPAPLLKDKYAAQRRKAKTLNFSIAYGKTPMGLSTDWNVNLLEAEATLELWYEDRPEVREWQNNTIDYAHYSGVTRTLLGRYRQLTDIHHAAKHVIAHAERAAINTPIQGGAADIVIRAMVKLYQSELLKKLGWRQILQIHDEIILEGPEETSVEALELVKKIMKNPLDERLLVDLEVDAKIAKTWFKAK